MPLFSLPLGSPFPAQKVSQWYAHEYVAWKINETEWIERKKGGKEEFKLVFWAGCHLAHEVWSRNSQGTLATGGDGAVLGAKSWLSNQCPVFGGSIRLQ